MHQELLDLCWEARSFLEPKWLILHESWGDFHPKTSSQYMCRYTSIFLKVILESFSDRSWQLVAGRPPSRELEGTKDGQFGFCTSDGLFFDHCWVQSVDLIVDLTADQFGAESIIITEVGDSRYHPNLAEVDLQKDLQKLSRRSEPWLREWFEDHQEKRTAMFNLKQSL